MTKIFANIPFLRTGGWISGDYDTTTAFARAWVRLFGAVVVSPSYRLAPEHKFPIGQNDALDSMKWIAEHGTELGADPTKGFIVGGVSAGASQSALITTQAVKTPLAHPITGQWLCVPSLMNHDNVPDKYRSYYHSMEHNKDAPILPASAVTSGKRHTEWDDSSPLRWAVLSDAPLGKLPPTYLQADGKTSHLVGS